MTCGSPNLRRCPSMPAGLARWWSQALAGRSGRGRRRVAAAAARRTRAGMVVSAVPEAKSVKNRIHADFSPTISRPRWTDWSPSARGTSTSVRVSRPGWCWPTREGNEFCVLATE